MHHNVRTFIDELGGYRVVAGRMGIGASTLHGYLAAGVLPARWYLVLGELARAQQVGAPLQQYFSFEALPLASSGATRLPERSNAA